MRGARGNFVTGPSTPGTRWPPWYMLEGSYALGGGFHTGALLGGRGSRGCLPNTPAPAEPRQERIDTLRRTAALPGSTAPAPRVGAIHGMRRTPTPKFALQGASQLRCPCRSSPCMYAPGPGVGALIMRGGSTNEGGAACLATPRSPMRAPLPVLAPALVHKSSSMGRSVSGASLDTGRDRTSGATLRAPAAPSR
eukprot:365930-Chlamydomonas_euryale.AAC.14